MRYKGRKVSFNFGFGLGTLIAVIVSWTANHSIGWMILHGILGWFYVIYYLIRYGIT